ncbi:META domain-containing protein [Hyphomicrobium sp.]|uniref:META domain-containing protein n=2 Tax=Hyphomicrobiales TaxID=356 RepID=UPI002D76F40C|nr:META domain-containing protein [Hyphomicrobium sp.]HET6388284.1 META domain-containing protein [Hyphomicrobium sp.]
MRFKTTILTGALALAMAAPVAAGEDDEAGPPAASWIAIELNGHPVQGLTFAYSADEVSGSGGCNSFSGPMATEDDAIKIGPLTATKMDCDGKGEIETEYFAALEAARSFSLQGDTLSLKGEDGSVLVKFKR